MKHWHLVSWQGTAPICRLQTATADKCRFITSCAFSKTFQISCTDHPSCRRLSYVWQKQRRQGFQLHTWREKHRSSENSRDASVRPLSPSASLWQTVRAQEVLLLPTQTQLLLCQKPFYTVALHRDDIVNNYTTQAKVELTLKSNYTV